MVQALHPSIGPISNFQIHPSTSVMPTARLLALYGGHRDNSTSMPHDGSLLIRRLSSFPEEALRTSDEGISLCSALLENVETSGSDAESILTARHQTWRPRHTSPPARSAIRMRAAFGLRAA